MIKKQRPDDQWIWVDEQNRLEKIKRKKTEMWHTLRNSSNLDDSRLGYERSFDKCKDWFEAGVLPEKNIQEAFENYMNGMVRGESIA